MSGCAVRRLAAKASRSRTTIETATYFERYRGLGPYHEVWSRFTDPAYLTDLIKIVWNRARGYKLLIAGLRQRRTGRRACGERGIDAWGNRKQPGDPRPHRRRR